MKLDGIVYNPEYIVKASLDEKETHVLNLELYDAQDTKITFEDIVDDKQQVTMPKETRAANALDAINQELDAKNAAAKKMFKVLGVLDTLSGLLDMGKGVGVVPK